MIWLIILGVLGLAGYGVYFVIKDMSKPRALVSIGKATLRAELAQTTVERQQGLAGRTELARDQAMLFVFERDERWNIWMKGMRLPIDIIWLDRHKKVIHITPDVWPDAEPHEQYLPDKPARYVLEVAAGTAKQQGITVGTQAKFSLGEPTSS